MKKIYQFIAKSYLILLLLFVAAISKMNAQTYVTIPDPGFVQYLQQNFAGCMNGNKLDISCSAVKNAPRLLIPKTFFIQNLFGVQYFINLINLECMDNALTAIPELPYFLDSLRCENNQLTALPPITPYLRNLYCDNNKITCLPYLPTSLGYISASGNLFKCIPNYHSRLSSYPICRDGDPNKNPYACPHAKGILGYAYMDENKNCIMDGGETAVNEVSFKLFDSGNNLIAKAYSNNDGTFQFVAPTGKYRIEMDTLGMPFKSQCVVDTTVILTDSLPNANNINFGILCKPGFDIGVKSITTYGIVFPGQQHRLIVIADDLSKWNNLNCNNAGSGQLKITVNGPVTYAGISPGALSPNVAGNVFTYTIVNFDSIKTNEAFNLLFNTNTTATATDSVCVDVEVIVGGDVNPTNNTKHFCYAVVNSFDPNLKEVYPFDAVKEGYHDWFIYTIHFQNTGNATAMNIRLTDTLDKNLDLKTLQILNSSHNKQVMLTGNSLEFKFPNIQLADSATDEKNSKGFLQYRIQPKINLSSGTTIANKAFIYFDYNAPIVTNTTLNHYSTTVSIPKNKDILPLNIYPNPGNGKYFIAFDSKTKSETLTVEVYNLLGAVVYYEKNMTAPMSIDLSKEPNGIYSIRVTGVNQIFNSCLIKK
ncbi:MAG: T9SS type A sorting domain-containing protein [Bacteroidia bacterium]